MDKDLRRWSPRKTCDGYTAQWTYQCGRAASLNWLISGLRRWLTGKCDDLSSKSQHPPRKLCVAVTQCLGGGAQREDCWSLLVTNLALGSVREAVLRNSDRTGHPAFSSGLILKAYSSEHMFTTYMYVVNLFFSVSYQHEDSSCQPLAMKKPKNRTQYPCCGGFNMTGP